VTENERQFIEILIRLKKRKSRGRRACTYQVTDPDGNLFTITNLKEFCAERNLNASNIIYYPKGSKKWRAKKILPLPSRI
jgi:hypothetical protein